MSSETVKTLDGLAAVGDDAQTPLAPTRLRLLLRSSKGTQPSVRTIQDWYSKGCPHETIDGPRGETRVGKLGEVLAWLRTQGLGYKSVGGVDPAKVSSSPADDDDQDEGAAADPQYTLLGSGGQLDQLVEARLLELTKVEPDFDIRIPRLRRTIEKFFNLPDGALFDAIEARTASQALKNCSSELRALEKAAMEYRVRRGELIERTIGLAMIDELGTLYVSSVESLPGEIAIAVKNAIAGVNLADTTAVQRVIVTATEKAVEASRVALAEKILQEIAKFKETATAAQAVADDKRGAA